MPRAKANEVEIEYEVIGQGEPLLLIQGFSTQMIMWHEDLCDEFVSRGFQVIRFDNRDVGLSSRLSHLGVPNPIKTLAAAYGGRSVDAPYDLYDMADDAAAVLDQLGVERAHVYGVSMGGMIAQCFAIKHPHRAISVTSMMSTTGARWASIPRPRALRSLLKRPPGDRDGWARQLVDFMRLVRGSRFHFNEDRIFEMGCRAYDRGIHIDGSLRQLAAIAATGDRTPALRNVDLPFLVVHGTEDPLVPVLGGFATRRAVTGSRLKLVDGLGHELPTGAWPIIAAAVRRHASEASRSPEASIARAG